MKYLIFNSVLLTVCWSLTGVAQAVSPIPAPDTPIYSAHYSSLQQEQIGKIATDYLLAHPEVLTDINAKLQVRQILAQRNPMAAIKPGSTECTLASR